MFHSRKTASQIKYNMLNVWFWRCWWVDYVTVGIAG